MSDTLPNQIASVNRRYRLPLGVGLDLDRGSHDPAHLTAPVTELSLGPIESVWACSSSLHFSP